MKKKIFFQVSQVASFRLKIETGKNVADTTFKFKREGTMLNFQGK